MRGGKYEDELYEPQKIRWYETNAGIGKMLSLAFPISLITIVFFLVLI
jgi:hypothetical protein